MACVTLSITQGYPATLAESKTRSFGCHWDTCLYVNYLFTKVLSFFVFGKNDYCYRFWDRLSCTLALYYHKNAVSVLDYFITCLHWPASYRPVAGGINSQYPEWDSNPHLWCLRPAPLPVGLPGHSLFYLPKTNKKVLSQFVKISIVPLTGVEPVIFPLSEERFSVKLQGHKLYIWLLIPKCTKE